VKSGRQKGGQDPSERVDHGMGRMLRAQTQMQDRKNLCTGVDGQPQPQYLLGAARPRPQFVQLERGKLEMTEKVLVKALCVLPSAGEPGGDRRMTVAEDTQGLGSIQSFGQRRQHDRDLLGRGFQPVQGGVTSCTEGCAAGLTPKRLDALEKAMLAISDQGVDVSIGDPGVRALGLGQAKPSVFTRLGAPRRLFTSHQGRTGRGDGPPPDEGTQERRQAGQSSGVRGLRRRWSEVRLAAVLDWAGP
jgi:hypothetical protein